METKTQPKRTLFPKKEFSIVPAHPRPRHRPRKFESPQALQDRIDEYFDSCWEPQWVQLRGQDGRPVIDEETKQPILEEKLVKVKTYNISSMSYYCGLTTEGLLEYGKRPEFSLTVRLAKAACEMDCMEELLRGEKKQTGHIFNLKCNHGYVEAIAIQNAKNPDGTAQPFDLNVSGSVQVQKDEQARKNIEMMKQAAEEANSQ